MATTTAPVKPPATQTVTATMSQWASGVRFEGLSQDAIYQAKRFLLDSIGCALGGYQQHDVVIALEVLSENCRIRSGDFDRQRQAGGSGYGVVGECANDPVHGLQRCLLEAGPLPSFRHLSGCDGVL